MKNSKEEFKYELKGKVDFFKEKSPIQRVEKKQKKNKSKRRKNQNPFKIISKFLKLIERIRKFVRHNILLFKKSELIEDIQQKEFFLLACIIYDLLAFVPFIFELIHIIKADGEANLFLTIGKGIALFLTIGVTIFFFVTKSTKYGFSISLFLFSFLLNISFVFYVLSLRSISYIDPIFFMFILVPALNLFLESSFSLLWILMYFVLYAVNVTEMTIMNRGIDGDFLEEDQQLIKQTEYFFMYAVVILFVIVSNYYFKRKISRERKLIEKITYSITTLDLESDFIKKIVKKGKETKVIENLKNIIFEMRRYRAFLPNFTEAVSSHKSESFSGNSSSSVSSSNNSSGVNQIEITGGKELYCDTKLLTVLFFDLNYDYQSVISSKNVSNSFNSLISIIHPIIEQNGGIITNMCGTSVYIAFGCYSISTTPLKKAIDCALGVHRKWNKRKNSNLDMHSISSYIVHQKRFFFGHFGTSVWRRFNLLGESFKEFDKMKKMKEEMKINPDLVVFGTNIYQKMKFDYMTHQLTYDFQNQDELFAVLSKKKKSNKEQEWMYEIQSHLDNEDKLQTAWNLYKENDFQNAKLILEHLKTNEYSIILQKIIEGALKSKYNS